MIYVLFFVVVPVLFMFIYDIAKHVKRNTEKIETMLLSVDNIEQYHFKVKDLLKYGVSLENKQKDYPPMTADEIRN